MLGGGDGGAVGGLAQGAQPVGAGLGEGEAVGAVAEVGAVVESGSAGIQGDPALKAATAAGDGPEGADGSGGVGDQDGQVVAAGAEAGEGVGVEGTAVQGQLDLGDDGFAVGEAVASVQLQPQSGPAGRRRDELLQSGTVGGTGLEGVAAHDDVPVEAVAQVSQFIGGELVGEGRPVGVLALLSVQALVVIGVVHPRQVAVASIRPEWLRGHGQALLPAVQQVEGVAELVDPGADLLARSGHLLLDQGGDGWR